MFLIDLASKQSGSVRLNADGVIVYHSPVFPAFELDLNRVRIVGELTTDNGPLIDDYFLCLAVDHHSWYEISNSAEGIELLTSQLQQRLEMNFEYKLISSTAFASNVLWPNDLAGQPMFTFQDKPKPWWKKWLPASENIQSLTDPVRQYLLDCHATLTLDQ